MHLHLLHRPEWIFFLRVGSQDNLFSKIINLKGSQFLWFVNFLFLLSLKAFFIFYRAAKQQITSMFIA